MEKSKTLYYLVTRLFLLRAQRGEKTNGVALIGYSHGEIQLWHVPSAKVRATARTCHKPTSAHHTMLSLVAARADPFGRDNAMIL